MKAVFDAKESISNTQPERSCPAEHCRRQATFRGVSVFLVLFSFLFFFDFIFFIFFLFQRVFFFAFFVRFPVVVCVLHNSKESQETRADCCSLSLEALLKLFRLKLSLAALLPPY